MIQGTKLLEVDRPTNSGRIYPKAVIESALADWEKQFNTKTMPIFKRPTDTPKMEDIVGYAENFRFEEGYLVADIGFLKDSLPTIFPDKTNEFAVRPNGSGVVDKDTNIIQEGYRMVGLALRLKPVVAAAVTYEKK